MIPMIFIGIILNHLGLLHGSMLFWYIFAFAIKVIGCSIRIDE